MTDNLNLFPRSSGVLLHPTSLPGRYGIGDLGENAFRFIDWLAECGQTIWQILPLGPTSYGDSPYQTLSALAGNPNLISLDKLLERGWLTAEDLGDVPDFPTDRVDYGWIIPWHDQMLSQAYQRFAANPPEAYNEWCTANADWLDDFVLFVALKDAHHGRPWVEWEPELVQRDAAALEQAAKTHETRIAEHRFRQWVFHNQWYAVRDYAHSKQIRLVGDIPIFVAHDSSDVWANPGLFYLEDDGQPTVVAGVPPDYFSATGQRWGNPLYRWDVMHQNGYAWWIKRFRAVLDVVDIARIDHFRGFEAYWEILASEPTAVKGEWKPGPMFDFFDVVQDALGELPLIAEDLGVITPEVEALRERYDLPGMKVLQFAWSDPSNPFLPHNYVNNCIVYSGTHDNNTTLGWWESEVNENALHFITEYMGRQITEANWNMIRLGMMSAAHTFVAPMQDLLSLGANSRMNTPGVEAGNWTWRMAEDAFTNSAKDRLAHLTWLYRRRPDQQANVYGDAAVN